MLRLAERRDRNEAVAPEIDMINMFTQKVTITLSNYEMLEAGLCIAVQCFP